MTDIDSIEAISGSVLSAFPGLWVRLVSATLGTYTSTGPASSTGQATFSPSRPTGTYEVWTSPDGNIWTDTGQQYQVNSALTGQFDAAKNGCDPTGAADAGVPLTALLNSAAGKGSVFVPYGTYLLSSVIVVPSNTHLVMHPQAVFQCSATTVLQNQNQTLDGAGDQNIFIQGGQFVLGSGVTGSIHANFSQVTNLRISGVTLNGANAGTAQALVANNVYNAQFDHLNINVYDPVGGTGHSCNGLWIRGGNAITVSDCIIRSGDDAIALSSQTTTGADDLYNVSVTNCYCDSRRGRVLDIETGVNNVYQITASNLTGKANSGVNGQDSDCIAVVNDNQSIATLHDITISNCTIDSSNALRGVHVDGAFNVMIENVVLRGAVLNAPFIATTTAGNSTSTSNVRFAGCVGSTSSTTFGGLHIAPATGGTITEVEFVGCRITGAGFYGANFNASSGAITSCAVRDCIMSPTTSGNGTGIYAHGTNVVSDCMFVGNRLVGGWANALREDSPCTANLWTNNDLTGNTSHAVFSTGGGSSAFRSNLGLNPVGLLTGTIFAPPTIPASGSTYTNVTGLDCLVYITCAAGVSVSVISLNSANGSMTTSGFTVAASSTSPPIPVGAGGRIALTYSGGTPTWQWIGA